VLVVFVAVVAGASPTGLAGRTSSNGAFRFTVGEDLGGGPSNESGVGVGVGATRRGRDDCAGRDIAAININAAANAISASLSGLGFRIFIGRILSDFEQNLQIPHKLSGFALQSNREEAEAIFRMRAVNFRFAGFGQS
jgi:hypothetical protein